MAKRVTKRMRVKALRDEEKAAIADRYERFIREELKPRILPAIQPTEFNYPVDIFGRWRASQYSFIQRYRSGFATVSARSSTCRSPVSITAMIASLKFGST